MLVEILEAARAWLGTEGVEYRVITGRDGGRIRRFLRRYYREDPLLAGLSIRRQRRPLGPLSAVLAGGAVKGPLLIWLSDTLLLGAPPALRLDAVYAGRVRGPLSRWCLVEGKPGGRLRGLIDKPLQAKARRSRALIGLYALADGALFCEVGRRVVAARQTLRGEYQLSTALLRYHARRPLSVREAGGWQDAGQPDTFLAAKERLLDRLHSHRLKLQGGPHPTVRKTALEGAAGLARERGWYAGIRRANPAVAASVPETASLRGGRLTLPYRDWPRLSDWYLYRSLYLPRASERTFAGFLDFVGGRLHRPAPAPADAAARTERMLVGKALERLVGFRRPALLGARPVSFNGRRLAPWTRLRDKFTRLASEFSAPGRGDWRTIHGDLVFSNALADGRGRHFLIDPRGSYGGVDGVEGDRYYDYAKIAQCVLFHYDCIKTGEFGLSKSGAAYSLRFPLALEPGRMRWHARFARFCAAQGVDDRRLRIFTASLLLSLLPMHPDDRQMTAACLLALDTIDGL